VRLGGVLILWGLGFGGGDEKMIEEKSEF